LEGGYDPNDYATAEIRYRVPPYLLYNAEAQDDSWNGFSRVYFTVSIGESPMLRKADVDLFVPRGIGF
jgi:hypothetical protein